MSDERTHYEVMGLPTDATPEQIKKRFRELARTYHPDLNPGKPEFHAILRRINQAYDTLNDPTRRASYDLNLADEARRRRQSGNAYGSPSAASRPGPASPTSGPRSAPPGAAREPRSRPENDARRRAALRLLDEARMAYQRGYFREAQRLCEQVIQIARFAGAYEMLGDIYSRKGNLAQALEHYTQAAQLTQKNGPIMAKLNRVAAQLNNRRPGPVTASRAPSRSTLMMRGLGRLFYRLTLTGMGLMTILFLMQWWTNLHDQPLGLPYFGSWKLSQLTFAILDGFLAGSILASAGWIRPFEQEMAYPSMGWPRRVVHLNAILAVFGAACMPLAFLVYILIAYLQNYLSPSILSVFGLSAALALGFTQAGDPRFQLETFYLAGNVIFVMMLSGWFVGDVFRPRWAR